MAHYAARYIHRGSVANADWSLGSGLTEDGTWRDLDCSGIILAGGVAAVVKITARDAAVAKTISLRKKGDTGGQSALVFRQQVANVFNEHVGVVAVDSNRFMQYEIPAGWDDYWITILGWFI